MGDLNEFMLRNGAHLDDSDTKLVNRYVQAVKKFHQAVLDSGVESQIAYGMTQRIPREILQRELALGAAEKEATQLREELRRSVRKVLAGEP